MIEKIKNKIRQYSDYFYYQSVQREIEGCQTVLDVGCGYDSPIGKIKKTFTATGIDAFKQCITESKKKKIHNAYVHGDIKDLLKYFSKKSFDAVIALDVVEHLEKKEAQKLIADMEKIAKKKVIIMTPNGFYHQDELFGNPHQVHKSEWKIKDFKNMRYIVRGLRGLKYIRGEHASIKYKPWFFWGMVAFISEPLLYFFPPLAHHIFAVKRIQKTT